MARTQAHMKYMYRKCNVKLEWFKMRQQNFVVCEPKFTNVSAFDVESIVAVNVIFCLSISLSILEIYAIRSLKSKSLKFSKNARTVDVGSK